MAIKKAELLEAAMAIVESGEYNGICIACGEEAYGVEPDARGYTCESCDKPKVYGAEELILMLA